MSMTEEMFDVLDETGQPTGEVLGEREVHQLGKWHAGAHLCVTDGRGHIYQQLRGVEPVVRILPNVWDLFIAAGHVAAGEDALKAIIRETEEEVGLRLTQSQRRQIQKVSITRSHYWVKDPTFTGGGYWHRAFDTSFVICIPGLDAGALKLEPNTVIMVRKYPIMQLQYDLKQPHNSFDYRKHAHRPVDDGKLYETVLTAVKAMTTA